MVTRTYTITEKDFPSACTDAIELIQNEPLLRSGVFFDIETTGFSPASCTLYLMGCCTFDGRHWQLTQWMAEDESLEEQRMVLEHFLKAIENAPAIISYNGTTFDLPFIEKKCMQAGLSPDFSRWDHVDLYKEVRSLKTLLSLENLKQKTVERFLGIYREDTYSGGALIPIYKAYVKTHTSAMEDLLLLHNFEDIKDMLFILPVLAYRRVLYDGDVSLCRDPKSQFPAAGEAHSPGAAVVGTQKPCTGCSLSVTLTPKLALPAALPEKVIPLPGEPELALKLCVRPGQLRLDLPLIQGEMKYFYDNFKDYYYLPQEDYAIHKSIAAYVDKDCRKKATAKTCYTKKTGVFLPQPEKIISPVFKRQYEDKVLWFEYRQTLWDDPDFLSAIQRFLRLFVQGSF